MQRSHIKTVLVVAAARHPHPPKRGWNKTNFDSLTFADTNEAGLGVVIPSYLGRGAPPTSHLGSSAGGRWHSHSMELHHQGVPERTCPILGRGFGAASSFAQGHGCLEARKAAGPFHVLEKGSCPGKLLSLPHCCLLFIYLFIFYF